jgi:hypothetical protein
LTSFKANALAQSGLFVAEREHEGSEDQPDRRVRKAGKCPGQARVGRLEAGLGQIGRAEQHVRRKHGHQGTTPIRPIAAPGSGSSISPTMTPAKDGEEIPGVLCEALRWRKQGDDDGHGRRRSAFQGKGRPAAETGNPTAAEWPLVLCAAVMEFSLSIKNEMVRTARPPRSDTRTSDVQIVCG